jgi:hypothetical protein
MNAMKRVIEFLCAQVDHQIAEDVADPVMVHAGVGAYCPSGASSDDHDWRGTGGRTLPTVREWLGRPDGRLLGLGQRLIPMATEEASRPRRP